MSKTIKNRLLYIAPHLSTGGLPQYLYKQLISFKDLLDIEVIEYENLGGDSFIVQKERIKKVCKVHTISSNKYEVWDIINDFKPNIIHFQEIPQNFMLKELLNMIHSKDRNYSIVYTTHSSLTNPQDIDYQPDRYILVNKWSKNVFENYHKDCQIWEYPIQKKIVNKEYAMNKLGFVNGYKHVLNVGLFTKGKNQGEIFDIARILQNKKIMFHFVGNQASNFSDYWKPLMDNRPHNCIVWGERNDVDLFYQACDLFYFSSIFELNPIAIKEALSYEMPCIFRKLPSYLEEYDDNPLVTYIDNSFLNTIETIKSKLYDNIR